MPAAKKHKIAWSWVWTLTVASIFIGIVKYAFEEIKEAIDK